MFQVETDMKDNLKRRLRIMAHEPENQPSGKGAGWLKKRTRLFVLLSAAVLLGIGLLVGLASGHPFDRLQEKLNLTDEQADQVMNLISETRKEAIPLRSSIKTARLEIGDLLAQEHVDEEAITREADTISQSVQELVHLWTATLIDIRDVLTPEQMQKARLHFTKFLARDHEGSWRERWGKKRDHEEQ